MAQESKLEEHLKKILKNVLVGAGWKFETAVSEKNANGLRLDFLCIISNGRERFLIVLEISSRPVRSLTEAVLARTALIAKKIAEIHNARPLAIVGAKSISRRMADSLRFFAQQYLDSEVAFGWIDMQNRLELYGSPNIEAIEMPSNPRKAKQFRSLIQPQTIFSDLSQWLFKVLLAPCLPSSYINAPRSRPENVRHLAQLAGVSAPTAHRLVVAAKNAGFIQDTTGYVSVVDQARLLKQWSQNAKEKKGEVRAKWILKKRDSTVALKKVLQTRGDNPSKPSACLGLFAAADHWGLGIVEGIPPHLLLRRVSIQSLREFGLREAESGENTDVFVRQPTYPESTFRGAIYHENLWVTDILQTWLDTVQHKVRGQEQAEHIHRAVLRSLYSEDEG